MADEAILVSFPFLPDWCHSLTLLCFHSRLHCWKIPDTTKFSPTGKLPCLEHIFLLFLVVLSLASSCSFVLSLIAWSGSGASNLGSHRMPTQRSQPFLFLSFTCFTLRLHCKHWKHVAHFCPSVICGRTPLNRFSVSFSYPGQLALYSAIKLFSSLCLFRVPRRTMACCHFLYVLSSNTDYPLFLRPPSAYSKMHFPKILSFSMDLLWIEKTFSYY